MNCRRRSWRHNLSQKTRSSASFQRVSSNPKRTGVQANPRKGGSVAGTPVLFGLRKGFLAQIPSGLRFFWFRDPKIVPSGLGFAVPGSPGGGLRF